MCSEPPRLEVPHEGDHAAMSGQTQQLVGRWGILLLVHQKPKPRGWTHPTQGRIGISEVVGHLHAMAVEIAAARPDAPQPVIECVDVSSAWAPSAGKQAAVKIRGKTVAGTRAQRSATESANGRRSARKAPRRAK